MGCVTCAYGKIVKKTLSQGFDSFAREKQKRIKTLNFDDNVWIKIGGQFLKLLFHARIGTGPPCIDGDICSKG